MPLWCLSFKQIIMSDFKTIITWCKRQQQSSWETVRKIWFFSCAINGRKKGSYLDTWSSIEEANLDWPSAGSGVLIKIFNTRLNTNTTLFDGGYFTAFKNKFGFESAVRIVCQTNSGRMTFVLCLVCCGDVAL